jgi:hypothetical protein
MLRANQINSSRTYLSIKGHAYEFNLAFVKPNYFNWQLFKEPVVIFICKQQKEKAIFGMENCASNSNFAVV